MKADISSLKQEMLFERGVQAYLWALPALEMYGMKEGSEKVFGKGYNILPIFKERMNAKTLIPTSNSDVINALGYLDLKEDGPLVIEVPAGLQGVLNDFWQRPLRSEGQIAGREWAGDVGVLGPDHGAGGRYLILAPDYKGPIPSGYFTYRSSTYGVFVCWRGFFSDPKQLTEPVKLLEKTRIYPLGKESTARPMEFPDASATPANMLFPQDGNAFDMLARFIDHEYVDPSDMEMRGVLAGIGIIKDRSFTPDRPTLDLLDKAARTASRMGHAIAYQPSALVPKRTLLCESPLDRPVPGNATFTTDTYNTIDARIGYFTYAYSTSARHGCQRGKHRRQMCSRLRGRRRQLPAWQPGLRSTPAARHSCCKLLVGYGLRSHLGVGLDNGQPFPSLNTMDKPIQNSDGSTDIYFGPKSPGTGKNWIATVPAKGGSRCSASTALPRAFFEQTWKPDDIKDDHLDSSTHAVLINFIQ